MLQLELERSIILKYPQNYIDFLIHFHGDRDYFECHEVLEEYWKESGMERDSIWVGLIQVAVSLYHYRRGNRIGAVKMMNKALFNISAKRKELHLLGIDYFLFIHELNHSYLNMKNDLPYEAFDFPIGDQRLLDICKQQCEERGYSWGGRDDMKDDDLVNRHMTRDRSSVYAERQMALYNRKRKVAAFI